MGSMRSVKLAFSFLCVFAMANSFAQLDIYPKPYRNNALWTVPVPGSNPPITLFPDTLFMGASFTRTSYKPVTVTLKGNEAGWSGDLLFIDPKTGAEDRLFSNHDAPGTTVVLSDRHDIALGDTVYFIYKVTTKPTAGNFPSANSVLPKYTGANIPGVSKYVTVPASAKWGHRWSVAGRLNDSLVIFGFEDNVETSSDFDYDDIVFLTTLSLANDEVPAHLTFVDKAGTPLAPGAFYSPGNDTVYLVYTDDFNAGKDPVSFNISVKNRKGLAAADVETFTAGAPVRNGITGTWTIAIPLQESPGIPGDKKLEVYFLGEVTATVASHTRNQIPDGNTQTATLNVAYPDKPETVKISSCPDSAAAITRTTTCVSIRVVDQSFTRNLDTVWVEVKCDGSGDILGKVQLLEQPDGSYKSGNIVKNEGTVNAGDAALTCKTTDNITVTYLDEVYNKKAIDKAAWSGDVVESLIFSKVGDLNTAIPTAKDGEGGNQFQITVKGLSSKVGVKDTLLVTLTTAQGDAEVVTVTETDVNSNVFTAVVDFVFQTTPQVAGNGKIEAFLDPTQVVLNVPVTGQAIVNGKPYQAVITLLPSLNLVKKAYIKDSDGDGRGDKVYIVFSRPLDELPTSVTPLYWNQFDPNYINKGAAPVISLVPGQPNTIVADFSANPFPKGLTSIPVGAIPPIATLPGTSTFGGQKPAIADSMGPIITFAEIHPFNNLTVNPNTTTQLNIDTLRITVSEPLHPSGGWNDLIRVGKAVNGACTDYLHSQQVVPNEAPVLNADGTFTILIGDGKGPRPLAGDCIYMNVNGGLYTDLLGNLPPIHGEPLKGTLPPKQIELFRGYPPVAGLNPNGFGFVVVNNDPRPDGSDGNFSVPKANGFETVWVPPADWPAGYTAGGTIVYTPEKHNLTDPNVPDPTPHGRESMPSDIGAIQVVSTGEYLADVAIFDNLGNWVKKFTQSFGYHGELSNPARMHSKGMVSYLVWDLKDHRGQKAANGVYVWKVVFRFKNGKQEIRYTRTGVTRNLRTAANP